VETVHPAALLPPLLPYHRVNYRLNRFLENIYLLVLIRPRAFLRPRLGVHSTAILVLLLACIQIVLGTLGRAIKRHFLSSINRKLPLFLPELLAGDVLHVLVEDSLLLGTFADLINRILPGVHHPRILFEAVGRDRQNGSMAQQLLSAADALQFLLGALAALLSQFGIFYSHYYKRA